MRKLKVLQSLWAMEQRRPNLPELPLDQQISKIKAAGFDGVGIRFADRSYVKSACEQLNHHDLVWEAQCYPKTVEDFKIIVDHVREFGANHVNLQPDLRFRTVPECLPILNSWRNMANDSDIKLNIETHRNRMTNDLYFTLDLIEALPDIRITADLSHYLVGNEFEWPVSDNQHALMHQILDNSWALHGRVASREQIQVQLDFPQHQIWVSLFEQWWEYAVRSWWSRSGEDETLTFLCELGPPSYAITDRNGEELSNRWDEALSLMSMIRKIWQKQETDHRNGAKYET